MTSWIRTSALDDHGNDAGLAEIKHADLHLRELPQRGKLLLQIHRQPSELRDDISSLVGAALPAQNNVVRAGETTVIGLGQRKWLLVAEADSAGEIQAHLSAQLPDDACLLSDVSDARSCFEVSGDHAIGLMAKVCALDLSGDTFGPGRSAQTQLARIPLLIHQIDQAPTYHLYVDRSLTSYAWSWLSDAANEYAGASI